jgi:hypothetical protein
MKITRIAPGDYDLTNAERAYHVFRQENVYPPAWEVEEVTSRTREYVRTVVNGAASYRDALALLREREGLA